MDIYMVGYAGCGKEPVGACLAEELELPVIGPADTAPEPSEEDRIVVCGDAFLEDPANRERAEENIVVWIDATEAELIRRRKEAPEWFEENFGRNPGPGRNAVGTAGEKTASEAGGKIRYEAMYKLYSDYRVLTDGYRITDIVRELKNWILKNYT